MAAGFSIFTLLGSILIDNEKANESINKTEKHAESMASKLGSGIKTVGALGLVVGGAAVAAGGALLALATKTAESADEIDKLSERTGINREELQRWKYAAEQSGADVGKLEVGIKKLSDVMDGASNGSKANIEAFDKLGISMDDLKNKSQSQIFDEVMNALAEMPEGAERNALGNDLLGKSYTEMLPLLNAGAGGMDALKKRADELGIVMSEDMIKANVVFGDSWADVKSAFGGVFAHLSNEFLPILQSMLDWVIGHMPEIQKVIGAVFEVVSKVTETAFRWFNDYLLPVFESLFDWVSKNWPTIKNIIKGVFDTLSPLVKSLWELFSISLLPIFKTLFTWAKDNFPSLGGIIKSAFGIIIDVAEGVVDVFIDVVKGIKLAIEWLGKWKLKDAQKGSTSQYGGISSYSRGFDGSNANGLAYVPFDGYISELHKGEEVLRADDPRNQNNNGGNLANQIIKGLIDAGITKPANIYLDGKAVGNGLINVVDVGLNKNTNNNKIGKGAMAW